MDVNKTPIIPSITGNPQLDSLLAAALIAAAGWFSGIIVGWLNAHGFNDPDLPLKVSGIVLSTLAIIATMVWRLVVESITRQRVVAHVEVAAATGKVPQVVRDAIKPADEPAITAALNRAQINKGSPT